MRATRVMLLILLVLLASSIPIATTATVGEINAVATSSDHERAIEYHRYLRISKVTKLKMNGEERVGAATPQFSQLWRGFLYQLPAAFKNNPVTKLLKWFVRLIGKGIVKLRRMVMIKAHSSNPGTA
ncbi:hypothetical protein F442_05253 [Phytophthora nicotianae P10297]|uniref:RxLR effector protein n=2 Tax=Phytophthora nicotianae TaxID=4792 RepID=V9FIX8_PHYNI|nr:hypothetical protein F443_05207 [Phytophthora nicotianae P1569]ETP49138.1 hypothetical protein F442_05253 [Phytophthora nicotianae P10297]